MISNQSDVTRSFHNRDQCDRLQRNLSQLPHRAREQCTHFRTHSGFVDEDDGKVDILERRIVSEKHKTWSTLVLASMIRFDEAPIHVDRKTSAEESMLAKSRCSRAKTFDQAFL